MAGYQKHKFDTTYVQPSSDGGWGALARGFSNGYSIGKAISGAINQNNIAEANSDYDKGMADLEKTDVVSPQELTGADGTQHAAIRLNEDQLNQLGNTKKLGETDERFKGTQYADMTQREYFDSQRNKMSQADLNQRRQSLADKRDQAIKDSFLRYEGQDAYDDYRIKQAQVSQSTLEGRIAEGRSQVLNDIMRIRKDPQFALQAATQMGFLPEGSRIDMKTGTIITPDGRTQQITGDMMNQFVRQYQREKYADLLTSMDDIFNADTYDARKEAIELKPWETKQKIALQRATLGEQMRHNRETEALTKEKYEAEKTKSGKPEDLYLGDPDGFGAKPILGKKTQKPTGYVQDDRGNRWPSEFNTLDDFRAAVEEAQKYGVETIQNNKTGAIGYKAGKNVFSSMTEAINYAKDYIKEVQKNAKKYHEDHVAKRAAPDIQRAAEAHKNSANNYFGSYEKDS